MHVNEADILIPKISNNEGLLEHVSGMMLERTTKDQIPVRFVITRIDNEGYHCELAVLSECEEYCICPKDVIFSFNKRGSENIEKFNAVLLIPTGIGAEIGGHSGDGGPLARLMASACDTLITHPNVVNASDINELPDNALYVEGSTISRLLMGTVGLQRVRANRIMFIMDKHFDKFFNEAAINSVSAARAAFGLDCPLVVEMDNRVLMRSLFSNSGRATGRIEYLEHLCKALKEHQDSYDAVALSSLIEVPGHFHEDYFKVDDMVNPWGGVEAMLTHAISLLLNVPSAHSPMMTSRELLDLDVGVVDPRKAAEAVSTTYLHCILKGLHKSPKIVANPSLHGDHGILTVTDISCLIIPYGCIGLPTLAALEQGIIVIAVKENKNRMQNLLEELPFKKGRLIVVDNYLEAIGVMHAIKAGVALDSIRRPLIWTRVTGEIKCQESNTIISMVENTLDAEKSKDE